MLDWIQEYADVIQIAASVITALVWIVYLQILVHTFRRQRRTSLLINRGGAQDMSARCLVSNMGSEPIYLQDVLAEIETGEDQYTASVVDHSELSREEIDRPEETTSQGPVHSGSFVDIGSFRDILSRADRSIGDRSRPDQVRRLTLIAIAASNQAQNIVAACRSFDVVREEGSESLLPPSVHTRQIRSWRKRRQLTRILDRLERERVMKQSVGSQLTGTYRPALRTG